MTRTKNEKKQKEKKASNQTTHYVLEIQDITQKSGTQIKGEQK
jgi:hypothetical protein